MATTVVRLGAPIEDATLATETLSPDRARTLYRRALADVCEQVAASGSDLLVTHHPDDEAAAVRDALDALPDAPDIPRIEPQVGSTPTARVGNTVTHLLETEGESSVGVLDPTAVLVTRRVLDQAVMTLRRSDVVVGPASEGATFFAAFGEPIDFDRLADGLAVEALVETARQAGLSVDVLDVCPTLADATQRRSALPVLRARARADLPVPERTVAAIEEFDL